MESAAVDQLHRVAALPGCRCAVGMPDLHPGRGIPIGAVFAFEGVVRPALVGGDAGCGALVVPVLRPKHHGDALLRRVLAQWKAPLLPDVDPRALLRAAWTEGPEGLRALAGIPVSLLELLDALAAQLGPDDALPPSGALPPDEGYAQQLGSVGGGNHFAEISQVVTVAERETARALGLERERVAVLTHSGSRHLGNRIAARWQEAVLAHPAEQAAYLADLAGCCRYARTNRVLLAWRLLVALGATRATSLGRPFDLVHNGVTPESVAGERRFVHRKGCAPAALDQPTVVLGSRGTPSWVMRGLGEPAALASVAHGAGRRLSRADAVDKLKARYRRSQLTRTAGGGAVLCDEAELLYAEHPDAYKAIEPVVASLEAAGAARRVAALLPVINVKR